MQNTIRTFNQTLEKSYQWLKELKELGQFDNAEEAYTAFHAVLHTLRNRLLINEVAHLGAQLPMLIRGFYYEGWDPAAKPNKLKTKEAFLEDIRNHLRHATNRIDAESAARNVFKFLEGKISGGGVNHIKAELPKDILSLWQ